MERTVMLILVASRKDIAPRVQQILTDFGGIIKTRLGLNQEASEDHVESGLIFLELIGRSHEHENLMLQLGQLQGVQAKLVTLAAQV